MLKTLTTAAGMVLLVSSFALAGQTAPQIDAPRAPRAHQRVTTQAENPQAPTQRDAAKKHHKHHKKHHAQSSKR
jgi:hypothetical protein